MRIKIVKDGPYLVTGGIPIKEWVIASNGPNMYYKESRQLPQQQTYALCRCGKSRIAPFCDGVHSQIGFDGTEVASREPFFKRATDITYGSTMKLYDDGRCAFARFCHTERGDTWELTEQDQDPINRQEAIRTAKECPAGRLVIVDNDGTVHEDPLEPEIIILQDPEAFSSSAIYVKGPIVVEAADGTEYEVRNRVTLCRCGGSKNKPFCDITHYLERFDDGFLNSEDHQEEE